MGRPTSVTLIAIFGIIIASMGVLGTLGGWLMYFFPFGPRNPALEALKSETAYQIIIFGFGGLKFLLTGVLLAGSIGSLQLRRWARKAMIFYACSDLVLLLISTVVNVIYLLPRITEATLSGMSATAPLPPGMRTLMQIIMPISAVVGVIFAAALPACILIFYNKTIVVNAFNGIFPPGNGFEFQPAAS